MKKLGTAALAASAMMALFGAGSASAANWDPPNTPLTGHGSLTLTTNSFGTVSCTVHMTVKSTGNDVATTVNAAGTADAPPVFSSCTSTLGSASVISDQPWVATATSTTAVDVTGNATITLGGGICRITVASASVANNTWSNTTHVLTANPAGTFPISESGLCDGGTTGSMTGSVTFPSSAIIT
jgi:hypothetical protein